MRAKLIDGQLVYAPRKIQREIDGETYTTYNPTDDMFAEQGWLLVVEYGMPDNAPEGYHYEPFYTEFNDRIVQSWVQVQDEITEEIALTRYANKITGENDPDLTSAAETMITRLMEV